MIKVVERCLASGDGMHRVYGKIYIPDGEIKGLFQVVHGMADHIGRYDEFMTALARKGFVAFGEDHVGHGKTARNEFELGFFAHKSGYKLAVNDSHAFAEEVRKEFPNKPLVLLGHSMGSFMARLIAAWYPKSVDALIIMGTGGKNPAAPVGIALASVICLVFGDMHFSKLIKKMAFGKYNDRTEKKTEFDWLATDFTLVEKYRNDRRAGFDFTVSGMRDLIKMNFASNQSRWYRSMPDIPVLIVSGTEDPVGSYGKGPTEISEKLQQRGLSDVTLKLYEGARHEILNDFCRKKTYKDIIDWSLRRV